MADKRKRFEDLAQKPHTIQPEEVDAALEWLRENGPATATMIGKAIGRSHGGCREGFLASDSRFHASKLDTGSIVYHAAPVLGEHTIKLPGHGMGLTRSGFAHHGIDIDFEDSDPLPPIPDSFHMFAIHPSLIDRSWLDDVYSLKSISMAQDYKEK